MLSNAWSCLAVVAARLGTSAAATSSATQAGLRLHEYLICLSALRPGGPEQRSVTKTLEAEDLRRRGRHCSLGSDLPVKHPQVERVL